ncbi:LysM peptidoglycan-binding domain-containing protein, partial [Streptomyces sp. NPDC006668]|uniref:LysM peptidoglycan-binding domain-containing protein n=1 Tax=Streptomyces sp. NPDC006668 TaxID=3156903 RepID=UPI0033D323F7
MDKRHSPRPGSRLPGLPGRPVWRLLTGLVLLCCAAVLAVAALEPVAADATAGSSTTSVSAPAARPVPAVKPAPRPVPQSKPVRHRSTAPAPRTTSVTLHPGDTLWALARDHGTTVAALQRLNKLGHSTLIYAGRSLRVPVRLAAAARHPRRLPPAVRGGAVRHTRASAPTRSPIHPLARQTSGRDRRTVTKTASVPRTTVHGVPGSPRQLAAQVFGSQYTCAAHIITRESGWN